METLRVLPAVEDRRFGSVTVGYDRVQAIRREHSALVSLASRVCAVPADKMTVRTLELVEHDIESRREGFATMDDAVVRQRLAERILSGDDEDLSPLVREVVAWAAVRAARKMPLKA